VPSRQPLIDLAKVVQTIDLGDRLSITGAVEENILGDALHAIFAAEFTHPQHPERLIAIKRILGAYNLDQNIKAEDYKSKPGTAGYNTDARDWVSQTVRPPARGSSTACSITSNPARSIKASYSVASKLA